MNQIRKVSRSSSNANESCKKPRLSLNEEEASEHNEDAISEQLDICSDTEAAIIYIKNILISGKSHGTSNMFPPVVFVHQLCDVVKSKTVVNRQIELLRNEKRIVLILLGNEENMKIVLFLDDLKQHVFQKCDLSEKIVYQKFFDHVLSTTVDIGVTRANLKSKFRFSENDIRFLVNSGLLILKETGILWFSLPSAGIFMKKMIKGRQLLLTTIKKRKYHEILEQDLKKLPVQNSLELPIMYHVHDLVGGKFVSCVKTTSGRLLRFRK